MLEQRQCRTRQPTLPYDKHIRRPQSYPPDFSVASWPGRGDQEGVAIHGGGGGVVADKIPFQAGRPTSKAGAPLPGHPGTQAAAAAAAQFIFWFVMRGGGQQSRPCYATCSPSAEVGAGAGAPPLTFSTRAGCAARLRCPIRQLRKWAVGRGRHLIHHLAQLAGVMEASSREYLEAALWQAAAAAAAGRPAAATRRPWQGHGHTGGLEGGGCT